MPVEPSECIHLFPTVCHVPCPGGAYISSEYNLGLGTCSEKALNALATFVHAHTFQLSGQCSISHVVDLESFDFCA